MFKKLKKGILAGTIFSAAANMHACVYGPPPDSVDNSIVKSDQGSSQKDMKQTTTTATSAKETEFDPSENQNEDVYGPPEMFGLYGGDDDDPSSEEEPIDESDTKPEFDPSENENAAVYGPPEWFEDK
ncbi:MAG: hypothetical protein IJ740_04755 [Ruminococcus sp.]|nr:hypothetical protein [Ruminococcus sp.]